jgi:hypothetical protein
MAAIAAPAATAAADDLDRVMRTCRGSCALRAVELLRRPRAPLVADALALRLAGPEAIAAFQGYWDGWEASEGVDESKHSYFAGRARVLDEIVQEEAAAAAAAAATAADRARGSGSEAARASVQVVSLGEVPLGWDPGKAAPPAAAGVAAMPVSSRCCACVRGPAQPRARPVVLALRPAAHHTPCTARPRRLRHGHTPLAAAAAAGHLLV